MIYGLASRINAASAGTRIGTFHFNASEISRAFLADATFRSTIGWIAHVFGSAGACGLAVLDAALTIGSAG